MSSETRTVYVCVYCETPIDDGYMYGAGDGTGQRFAHPLCWVKQENKRLTAEVERLTQELDNARAWSARWKAVAKRLWTGLHHPLDMCEFEARRREAAEAERDALAAQVAALREALGLAIAGLTNLSELRILTGQYRTEANELVERLCAALAAAGGEAQG